MLTQVKLTSSSPTRDRFSFFVRVTYLIGWRLLKIESPLQPIIAWPCVSLSFPVWVPEKCSPFRQTIFQRMANISAPYEGSTFEWSPLVQICVFIIYGVIIVLSLLGNTIVILVILRCKPMQSITNLFITNLAVSDILMSLVAAPFTPIAAFSDTWVLPQFFCKLLGFTMGVSVYVSTLTSTAIAVDRYLVIVHPFFTKMRNWVCGVIIATIWAIATFICLPLAIHQTTTVDPSRNVTICTESWPPGKSRLVSWCLSKLFTMVYILSWFIPIWVKKCSKLSGQSHQKIDIKNLLDSASRNDALTWADMIIVGLLQLPFFCFEPFVRQNSI